MFGWMGVVISLGGWWLLYVWVDGVVISLDGWGCYMLECMGVATIWGR